MNCRQQNKAGTSGQFGGLSPGLSSTLVRRIPTQRPGWQTPVCSASRATAPGRVPPCRMHAGVSSRAPRAASIEGGSPAFLRVPARQAVPTLPATAASSAPAGSPCPPCCLLRRSTVKRPLPLRPGRVTHWPKCKPAWHRWRPSATRSARRSTRSSTACWNCGLSLRSRSHPAGSWPKPPRRWRPKWAACRARCATWNSNCTWSAAAATWPRSRACMPRRARWSSWATPTSATTSNTPGWPAAAPRPNAALPAGSCPTPRSRKPSCAGSMRPACPPPGTSGAPST